MDTLIILSIAWVLAALLCIIICHAITNEVSRKYDNALKDITRNTDDKES